MAAGGGERESSRSRPYLSRSCILLIVVSGMERFVFKGVASNLVTYLTDVMKMSNSSAAKTVSSWCGFTSMLPLLVAPLADSYWDRYSTILASAFLYVLGLVALTSTALARSWSPTNMASLFLFSSLYLISLGQGGYNPSLQAFGADQLDHHDAELLTSNAKTPTSPHPKKKSLFFQWWYFGVCSGSLLGVTVMSYIQDNFGWVIGFAIPMCAMVSSVALFACGTRIYRYKTGVEEDQVEERRFVKIMEIFKATASRLMCCTSVAALSNGDSDDDVELELQESKPLCHESSGAIKAMVDKNNMIPRERVCVPDKVKLVLRLLPIWTMLLMFAVIFQQPATFFTKQGMTMERNIGADFKIPPATLQSAITISIILLMPLYDKVLIPITRLFTGAEKGITVMQRMGVGMFLSTIAMILAALVEAKRLMMTKTASSSPFVPLSIFWLLPQYIILGISDIFTVVGMQEFFYSEVPVSMRTTAFALYNSVFGVGSFCSAIMISVVELLTSMEGKPNWFSDDMREARLDKYYWLLAFCSGLSFVLYVIWCKCCRTSRINEEETQY
ncbi:protein NRT1/ PTR FAMILY 5.8-like [Benincasa hispida]|uniref:protein NRT1/ PTR FAMILY 5.8-like n=1 Tax=Benincasa hispida TaxID=102211 RepID=UPI0018FFAA01|nr:protein NRT1/ PTR FAMILY 5.8-like [Benincasa hispida]